MDEFDLRKFQPETPIYTALVVKHIEPENMAQNNLRSLTTWMKVTEMLLPHRRELLCL